MSETAAPSPGAIPRAKVGRLRRLRWPLMIEAPIILVLGVAYYLFAAARTEATDNAYVQIAKTPVAPSIAGRVVEIYVRENQVVRRGQVLRRLDARDLQANLHAAEAEVATARLALAQARAAYERETANVVMAQNNVAHTGREATRLQQLATAGVNSRQQADEARHAAQQARDQLAAVRQTQAQALAGLGGRVDIGDAAPSVQQALARLERARLNLSYATMLAPADGVVARVDQMPVGAYLNASQTAFWLLSGRPWVEANFKEDQLAHMRVGQPATIEIDAYPGGGLAGRVASFAPGTGSAFSVLPAQNATGNWVNVTQRLPVRIEFVRPPPDMAARAGLSATVTVDVQGSGRATPRRE